MLKRKQPRNIIFFRETIFSVRNLFLRASNSNRIWSNSTTLETFCREYVNQEESLAMFWFYVTQLSLSQCILYHAKVIAVPSLPLKTAYVRAFNGKCCSVLLHGMEIGVFPQRKIMINRKNLSFLPVLHVFGAYFSAREPWSDQNV